MALKLFRSYQGKERTWLKDISRCRLIMKTYEYWTTQHCCEKADCEAMP